jgi:hypothetical protein
MVTIKKDGSGTFTMLIDLSQVKLMLSGFGGDAAKDGSPFSNMEQEYELTRSQLEGIKGITNIKFSAEMDGYLIKSGFDFSSVEALNKGMDIIYEREIDDKAAPEYYKLTKNSFERTDAHNFLDQVKNELASDELQIEGMDIASLFSEVVYVNEISFTGRKIKKVKSGKAEISDDGSKATNKYYIFKDETKQSLEFKLKVK